MGEWLLSPQSNFIKIIRQMTSFRRRGYLRPSYTQSKVLMRLRLIIDREKGRQLGKLVPRQDNTRKAYKLTTEGFKYIYVFV